MSNNYKNYYNAVNFHNRTKNYQMKKPIHLNGENIREVEINSLSQTEPSKKKEIFKNSNKKKIEKEIEQFDNFSKTNDETLSITNFKQEFSGNNTDDIIYREFANAQIKNLINKLEDIDFDKRFDDISNKINDVNYSIQNQIEGFAERKDEEIKEMKELFNRQCLIDLRKNLIKLKGEQYAEKYVISNAFDFEKYYYSILPYDLKEKFIKNNTSFTDIINKIYLDFSKNNKKEENLNDKFWFIVNSFSDENDNIKEKKLTLNLRGNIYRIIKHFRGLSDEIIIDFGEIICCIDKKEKINKAKKLINIIVRLIYEILSRQFEISEIQNIIFSYGHFYYGSKGNNIELEDFEENSIYYDFIELN